MFREAWNVGVPFDMADCGAVVGGRRLEDRSICVEAMSPSAVERSTNFRDVVLLATDKR